MTAAASECAEVDTARPFRSVKEAVAVFGDRILVNHSHSRQHSSSSSSATTIATPKPNANTTTSIIVAAATPSTNHEPSSSISSTMTFSPTPTMAAEIEPPEITPAATVPMMYSAPSSPTSLASSSLSPPAKPPPCSTAIRHGGDGDNEAVADGGGGLVVVTSSIEKLESDVAETRQEVARLRRRGSEMEMALASLNAQLHRGLSKLAEMEAAAARRRVGGGGDTDGVASSASLTAFRSGRWWGDRLAASGEYLPSFSHAMSLGEMDDGDGDELVVGSCRSSRRRKAQKVKPIVPLIGDILFNKRKSSKEKGDDGFFSGDLHGVIG